MKFNHSWAANRGGKETQVADNALDAFDGKTLILNPKSEVVGTLSGSCAVSLSLPVRLTMSPAYGRVLRKLARRASVTRVICSKRGDSLENAKSP